MRETQPLVTVLMPCYNAMPFLVEALESIINQTYSNLEILCINDGSSDETGIVLEKYALQDKRIRVIHNETNIKLIKTLNKGIELAQGEFIARMDADDIAALNRIEIELNYMLSNPSIDIISCGLWVISESGKVISEIVPRQHTTTACFFASFFYVPIGHPELLVKTKVFKDNHFLEEKMALHTEDYELWSRLLRKGYNLQNMDAVLHSFRINSQSVSRKYTEVQDNNFVECVRQHYFEYSGKLFSSEVMRVIVNRINHNLLFSDLKFGLEEICRFKDYFVGRENSRIDKQSEVEIQIVYYTQIFDICYQVMKKSTFKNKLFALWILLINIKMVFNNGVLTYLRNKIF